MKNRYFNPKRRVAFFEKILMEVPSTNTFDLSFPSKLSFNMGQLVPILCQEVVPGDKFNIRTEHQIKVAPLVFPTMHRVKVQTHYFFVPNRLLWPNFETFQAYDTLNDIPVHPYVSLYGNTPGNDCQIDVGSLADYLGIPTGDFGTNAGDLQHPLNKLNALPFAAYFKIFDDYFRDQNLMATTHQQLADGDNSLNGMFFSGGTSTIFKASGLLNRCWEKDYFTSALPFAQKGQEVVLPLGTTADLVYDPSGDGTQVRRADDGNPAVGGSNSDLQADNSTGRAEIDDFTPGTDLTVDFDVTNSHKVDLQNATAATINDFRKANRLQEFFERNARLGTRYIEQMLGKFGVRISDERAHRAEYIGGTTAPLAFGEILQTSQTDSTPLGQMAGYANSINSQGSVNYYCEEHGWIIGVGSVLPETNYFQGLHRKFLKEDILDYYDPMFANLGEQAVTNGELFIDVPQAQARATFGYQSRYSEMKYNSGSVHGEFRNELRPWHMARAFDSLPSLNDVFVRANPTHDIFADTDPSTQKIYAYFFHHIISRRKIPFFSTPNLQGFSK